MRCPGGLPRGVFYSKMSWPWSSGIVFVKMNIKNELAFLFPAPKTISLQDRSLDIQNLCFPLEITKKYDFLFAYFAVKNKNRGLEISCQEKKALAAEEYVMECDASRIVLWSNSQRGQFYALSTLLQILAYHRPSGRMPGFFIKDSPAVPFRGFLLDVEHGAFPLPAELQRLLLRLALLKFNYFSLALGGWTGDEKAAGSGMQKAGMTQEEIGLTVALAGKMGIDMFPAITVGAEVPGPGEFRTGVLAPFRSKLVHVRLGEKTDAEPAAAWFDRFRDTQRFFKAQGKTMLVWGDDFLKTPELIRKIPQEVLVLNGDDEIEKTDGFRKKAGPFKKHNIPQVLGSATWGRARFVPAMRQSAANNAAAFEAAREDKLAGVLLSHRGDEGDVSFLEGIILPLFQGGNLFWSGQAPRPEAFTRWALGFNEPDLFRVYTFLSQVDSPLQHSHWQYLFEDPVFATFSRQDNVKEIVARYRKASQYLKKRKIIRNEMSDFLNIAQHVYQLVAGKVEFSSRLPSWLRLAGGEDPIQQELDRLLPECEKLKDLFCGLWLKRRQPYGLARKIREFDFLQERFQYILRSMAHPAARKKLLSEFEDYSPADR